MAPAQGTYSDLSLVCYKMYASGSELLADRTPGSTLTKHPQLYHAGESHPTLLALALHWDSPGDRVRLRLHNERLAASSTATIDCNGVDASGLEGYAVVAGFGHTSISNLLAAPFISIVLRIL